MTCKRQGALPGRTKTVPQRRHRHWGFWRNGPNSLDSRLFRSNARFVEQCLDRRARL